jgi:hypothetical protein
MDKIIGQLQASVLGFIATEPALADRVAGPFRGVLGNLTAAGATAVTFAIAGMAPQTAMADTYTISSIMNGGQSVQQQQQAERQASVNTRVLPGTNQVGPQFPPNETLIPNKSNGLVKTVGTVAGGVAGGVIGNLFGHGAGKAAMTALGAVGGMVAGRTAGDAMTRPEAVDMVGQSTTLNVPGYGPVAVSPAPWGNLSPFMAQIQGFSQPSRSLASNPRARQALDRAFAQLEDQKRQLEMIGARVNSDRQDQIYAVSGQEQNATKTQTMSASRDYTDAEHVYLGVGVVAAKNMLDNLTLQGYDLREYKARAMADLDVPVNPQLRLKGGGAYNPQIARLVMSSRVDAQTASVAPAASQDGQSGATYATAQTGAAGSGQVAQNNNSNLVPQDQLPPGVTSRLKSSGM